MDGRQTVVVVSDDAGMRRRWSEWLEHGGFEVRECAGPHVVDRCPRLSGLPCVLRESADAAVVDVDAGDSSELYGGWPERLCSKTPDDGRTVVAARAGVDEDLFAGRIRVRHPVTRSSLLVATAAAVSGELPSRPLWAHGF